MRVLAAVAAAFLVMDMAPARVPAGIVASQQTASTPTFVCGEDESIPAIPLSAVAVILAGDGRFYTPCPGNHPSEHRENREEFVVAQAYRSEDPQLRARAAQAIARNSYRPERIASPGSGEIVVDALGGFVSATANTVPACAPQAAIDTTSGPRRWQPGRLFFLLRGAAVTAGTNPRQPPVPPGLYPMLRSDARAEAIYGIGVRLLRADASPEIVQAVTRELRACYQVLTAEKASAIGILENLGLARYQTRDQFAEAEAFLIRASQADLEDARLKDLIVLDAASGLEALYRRNGQQTISNEARARLHQLVVYGNRNGQPAPGSIPARIRRLALMAMQSARDRDYASLKYGSDDGDWQVRRIAAASLDLSDSDQAALGDRLAADSAFQVRYELLGPLSRLAAKTGQCAPIIARFADSSPAVVMRAMDVLNPACADLDQAIAQLVVRADKLARSTDAADWQVNARALTALARVRPDEARSRIVNAAAHTVWQVRAAAAAASVSAGSESVALTLARDPEPNVQTAALDALVRLRSAAVAAEAIRILRAGSDYQVLRMAALALKGCPDEARSAASAALLVALRKLTAEAADTSRDPRVAILDRLSETLSPAQSPELLPFMTDVDDQVNAAARKTFEALTHAPPQPGPPNRRYPYQPPASALGRTPTTAQIELEDGMVTLSLLRDVAPVTVARFIELVNRGYYNGLTFHRVVPNFVVQGGSPGANEYVGTDRYMRDEVGPQGLHLRGAVGISTRGGDTGDGQMFIDLVDLPRLDRDYTVFAYVTSGMELIDRLLEGGKIVKVSLR